MNDRTRWMAGIAVGALLASTAPALAGLKTTSGVTVSTNSDGSGWASGAIQSTRDSSDSTQYLRCEVVAFASGSRYATCIAEKSAGVSFDCTSSVDAIVDTVEEVGAHSYVHFNANTAGDCTSVTLRQGSQYGI